jgi:transposase
MPKTYDPEFKTRAVRLVRDHLADYGSVTAASFAVGAQLGVSRETLRRWVAQAEVDDGARPGLTTAEADELRRLRAENKRLREANEGVRDARSGGDTVQPPAQADQRADGPEDIADPVQQPAPTA